jgi:serine/threonine-protein phosphatase 2B catalytic subunit
MQIEHLIKKTLEEDDDQGVVEKLADRIAGVRKITGRPRALKRFETA